MSDNRTYSGDLINQLLNTVEVTESKTRKEARPVKEADAPKYWNIKRQQWLSLDETLYLNMLDKERK